MDTFNDLPLHPLIVHVVVVVVPVAALVAIVAAVWPRARTAMGPWPSILALVGMIATFVAMEAGEWLKDHLRLPEETIGDHADVGDVVIIGVGCLFGAVLALYLLQFSAIADRIPAVSAIDVLIRVLTVAAAGASLYLVLKAGDTGAEAVWGGTV